MTCQYLFQHLSGGYVVIWGGDPALGAAQPATAVLNYPAGKLTSTSFVVGVRGLAVSIFTTGPVRSQTNSSLQLKITITSVLQLAKNIHLG